MYTIEACSQLDQNVSCGQKMGRARGSEIIAAYRNNGKCFLREILYRDSCIMHKWEDVFWSANLYEEKPSSPPPFLLSIFLISIFDLNLFSLKIKKTFKLKFKKYSKQFFVREIWKKCCWKVSLILNLLNMSRSWLLNASGRSNSQYKVTNIIIDLSHDYTSNFKGGAARLTGVSSGERVASPLRRGKQDIASKQHKLIIRFSEKRNITIQYKMFSLVLNDLRRVLPTSNCLFRLTVSIAKCKVLSILIHFNDVKWKKNFYSFFSHKQSFYSQQKFGPKEFDQRIVIQLKK